MNKKTLDRNVLEILGLQNLPKKEKDRAIKQIEETIDRRILLRLLMALSPEEQGMLAGMTEASRKGELDEFLTQRFPDIQSITAEEVALYKQEMAEVADIIREQKI